MKAVGVDVKRPGGVDIRRVGGLFVVLALSASAGCSDSTSGNADPLHGVSEAVAARLCRDSFAGAEVLRTARQTGIPDGVDAAASGYERLAAEASSLGAKAFASELSDAAKAAHALAQSNRDLLATGSSGSSSELLNGSSAALMTKVMKLQLPETQMALACYSRGRTPFGN